MGDWEHKENRGVCKRSGQDPSSASFDTLGLTWSEARFNVGLGSKHSNDAFGYNNRLDWSVEERYVDGISMSTGEEGSREHLFTYALGWPGVESGNIACP